MTTLETADGRLMRAQRPSGATYGVGGSFTPAYFPPMWSNGEREGDEDMFLRSFDAIYRSQPVIAGVVDKLARRIATLPFDSYRRLPNHAREVVYGDTLDSLIRRPMPRTGTVHLIHQIAQSLLVHGNAVVAKLRGADREAPPVMLWPLDWSQMSAYGPLGGQIEWWSTTQFEGQERFISADDVILFAWPSPSGGEIGVSPLEKLGVTIRLEDAAQRHQTALFRNGTRPSLAVSIDSPDVKVERLEYARQRVEAMHKGVDFSGKTFFMGANVKLQPLSLSPVETALIDQRKLNREEVGAVFDLAGPLMNDLEHGTFSNVTELLRSLYRDVLPPWLGLIEETIQTQLLDVEPAWTDRFCEFDLTDKLKGDPVELATSLKLQVEAGLLTRNEARRILNLPPIGQPDDPDEPANQLTANVNNQASLDQMGDSTPLVSPTSRE
jgi:HK97 family phage portal protein